MTALGTHAGSAGPLAGKLVVDLSRALAGPHAAMMLGDLGARVIKVENPDGGDDTRGWGPPFVDTPEGRESTYFLSCNRNKESIRLDLKAAEGKATLRELLRRADVLVENFRPGTLDRLGFDPASLEELNPGLVVLAISGFGHDGPEGHRAGYDQIAQGEAGLMSLTGSGPGDPQRVGVPIGDVLAGIHGAYGVLAALLERGQTGRGQVVRTSLLSSIVSVLAFQGTRWTVGGEVPQAQGNHHPSIAPYGLFRCAGGAVQIAVGSEGLWRRFAAEFGLSTEDERWRDNQSRVVHRVELIETIEAAFSGSDAEELLSRLEAAGVPGGRVRSLDEVFAWEQARSQHLAVELQHPTLGRIEVPGSPLRFFQPDGTETTRLRHSAPPRLGEHDDPVRAWLDGPVLPGGTELLKQFLDAGSFRSWDRPVPAPQGADAAYLSDLARARERSGTDESVVTGEGRLDGQPVAVVASEFGFLGGSIGRAAAERIIAAIEEAGRRRLPLVAAPASGGTRMQEGTLAFLQMVRITEALTAYKRLGLPYLAYLRHPSTGGVFASWGSLGHLTVAEPGGLVGFLGPKVYAGLTGQEFPAGIQRSEHLLAHGTVDAVLDVPGFRSLAAKVLGILSGKGPWKCAGKQAVTGNSAPGGDASAWDSVLRTRDAGRPGLAELLDGGFGCLVRLHGTGRGAASASTAVVLAELEGRPVVVVGQDRTAQRAGSVLDAAGLAQARRGMRLAEELGLPLVTVVDTPGAELSVRAEESAIAGGIADCIAGMLGLTVPSVAVLLGEGTGGGALALAAARRTVAAEHAWLAPLPPEGASIIVHGDTSLAPELSERQRIGARALLEDGAVDEVVGEGEGFLRRLAEAASRQIAAQL